MATWRRRRNAIGTKFCINSISAVAHALAAAVLALASLTAVAAAGQISQADQQCLGCHGTKGMETKAADGDTLSLYVQADLFAKSVHSMIGCAVCHGDATLANHPPLKKKIASVREHSLELTKVCSSCHGAIAKQYQGSIHATLLRNGVSVAPVCSDCHSPHAVMAKAAYDAASGAPCSKCHDSIFGAYKGSVHGKATLACSNCHKSHDVSPAAGEDKLKNACLGCHPDALTAHQTWLPNSERHFDAVSCPACHVPGAKRKVDLRLYDNVAQRRVAEREGVPQFESRVRSADAKGVGLDAMALHSLLREFGRDRGDSKMTLRGRLEVANGVEAHQLTRKDQAIRDCTKCHQQGADPFQSVTVSIVGPDGRPVRYGAQKEVLNSIISVDSVSGFYAIGGTRIKLLDALLVLALMGGFGVPIGHATVRWLFKKYAKKISGKEDS